MAAEGFGIVRGSYNVPLSREDVEAIRSMATIFDEVMRRAFNVSGLNADKVRSIKNRFAAIGNSIDCASSGKVDVCNPKEDSHTSAANSPAES
jgi:hypothetical protein